MNKKALSLGMIIPLAAAGAVATAPAASANSNNYNHWTRVSCDLEATTINSHNNWRRGDDNWRRGGDNWRRGNDRVRLDFNLDTHSNRDRGRWIVVFKKHSWTVASSYPQRTYYGDLRVVRTVGSGPGLYSATAYNWRTGQECTASDSARPVFRPVWDSPTPYVHGGEMGPVRPHRGY